VEPCIWTWNEDRFHLLASLETACLFGFRNEALRGGMPDGRRSLNQPRFARFRKLDFEDRMQKSGELEQSPVFLSLLCAHALCSCFVVSAHNHILRSQIACFMLMLCALCLAVRDKKTHFLPWAGASRKSVLTLFACFVHSAWRAVTKKPDKHKVWARSTKHEHKAWAQSTKQRQKNWALPTDQTQDHQNFRSHLVDKSTHI
jgi:hypothetical protein